MAQHVISLARKVGMARAAMRTALEHLEAGHVREAIDTLRSALDFVDETKPEGTK